MIQFNDIKVFYWTTDEVVEWVERIGFGTHLQSFRESRVDGDLLLQIDERHVRDDLGLRNGIHRKRFMRELKLLKRHTNYSPVDHYDIAEFLGSIDPELREYSYGLIKSGLSLEFMSRLNQEDLHDALIEAGVHNGIHRRRITESVVELIRIKPSIVIAEHLPEFCPKSAELASLIKMHLRTRGFYVRSTDKTSSDSFDVAIVSTESEFFKFFDSRNAILVIHPDFKVPKIAVNCHYRGVRWVHEYQDACIDKIFRLLRGK